MQTNAIIEDMKKLGFSEYEVKAYMSLLEQYPLNGYGLSKQSGVPRSRIYEVLGNLEDKQLVFKQVDGEATVYYPLEPELLVEKLKKEMTEAIQHVQSFTHKLFNKKKEDRRMININGYDDIINFIELLIDKAKDRVAISIWEEEGKHLSEALQQAAARGVTVRGVYFGKAVPLDTLVTHRRLGRYMAEKKERHVSITIDGEQVISGVMSRGSESRVSWIKDTGFVEMTEDYISHDVMVNGYAATLSGKEKEAFERFTDLSRRDYFNYTEEEFDQWKFGD